MPVTYCQTPPPVVEETGGEVRVTKQLQQVNMVGFSGAQRDCLKLLVHQPARVVFTVGASLLVRDLQTGQQEVHVGHNYPVVSVSLSSSGHYLATGEAATLGVRAMVVCWDTRSWSRVGCHQTHHGRVEAVAISEDDCRLVSLGGQDDQSLVVWSISDRSPVCSHRVGNGKSGPGRVITFVTPDSFLTGGQDLLQCWTINGSKLSSTNISLGKLKRELISVERDAARDCVYFGSSSGDIVKVRVWGLRGETDTHLLRSSSTARLAAHRPYWPPASGRQRKASPATPAGSVEESTVCSSWTMETSWSDAATGSLSVSSRRTSRSL